MVYQARSHMGTERANKNARKYYNCMQTICSLMFPSSLPLLLTSKSWMEMRSSRSLCVGLGGVISWNVNPGMGDEMCHCWFQQSSSWLGGGGVLHKAPTSIEHDNKQFHYYFDIYYLLLWVAMNTSFVFLYRRLLQLPKQNMVTVKACSICVYLFKNIN